MRSLSSRLLVGSAVVEDEEEEGVDRMFLRLESRGVCFLSLLLLVERRARLGLSVGVRSIGRVVERVWAFVLLSRLM